MSLATDMGSVPALGVLSAVDPGTGLSRAWPGTSAILPGPYRKPFSGELSQVGNGGVTTADRADRFWMSVPSVTNRLIGFVRPIIGRPYTIDVGVGFGSMPATTDGTLIGIALYDGTKYETLTIEMATTLYKIVLRTWTAFNGTVTVIQSTSTAFNPSLTFVRVTDDATNRVWYFSNNGKDYALFKSEATNTFLTPTQFGLAVYNGTASPALTNAAMWCYHMQITDGILGDAL